MTTAVAVKVTPVPRADGLAGLEARLVAVNSFTVCVRACRVELPKWEESPLYDAVILCAPTVRVDVVNVAVAVVPGMPS